MVLDETLEVLEDYFFLDLERDLLELESEELELLLFFLFFSLFFLFFSFFRELDLDLYSLFFN